MGSHMGLEPRLHHDGCSIWLGEEGNPPNGPIRGTPPSEQTSAADRGDLGACERGCQRPDRVYRLQADRYTTDTPQKPCPPLPL